MRIIRNYYSLTKNSPTIYEVPLNTDVVIVPVSRVMGLQFERQSDKKIVVVEIIFTLFTIAR